MSNRFSKPVAFNREKDKELLKHIARKNFSGYVKKLIQADMQCQVQNEPKRIPVKKKPSVQERLKQAQPKVFRPNGGIQNG
ncbi:hypothetical protein vBBceSLY5_0037 [Bacillus phage vB_BceS_LY5]|uniref:hypothetical protein n=1 Tax=Bacillus phage vB_BceS_LY5 TaxID=2996058 RepID=UPI0040550AD2|nr:hypothetical protein vBBceSLY5_0037 [Bacillus phage vB_BceS_LY5]